MSLFPGPGWDWVPLGWQGISPVASTALTIPAISAGTAKAGAVHVAVILIQIAPVNYRSDGQPVAFTNTGGLILLPGDQRTIFGLSALQGVRLITITGVAIIEYYYFRPGPAGRT